MGYVENLLSEGERITLHSHQHWLAVPLDARWGIVSLIAALGLFIVGGAMDPTGIVGTLRQIAGWVTLVLFVLGVGRFALTIANWMNEEYLVTNRRVMKVTGLINKHSADSSLEKINDAVLDQNVFGRIFNYGDLDIMTAAEETIDRYRMLSAVITFKKEILNQKHQLEFEQMRPPVSPPFRAAPPPPPAMSTSDMTMGGDVVGGAGSGPRTGAPAKAMTPAEVTQTLAGLADLRDRGAITPEEFEAKKADLLGRL